SRSGGARRILSAGRATLEEPCPVPQSCANERGRTGPPTGRLSQSTSEQAPRSLPLCNRDYSRVRHAGTRAAPVMTARSGARARVTTGDEGRARGVGGEVDGLGISRALRPPESCRPDSGGAGRQFGEEFAGCA